MRSNAPRARLLALIAAAVLGAAVRAPAAGFDPEPGPQLVDDRIRGLAATATRLVDARRDGRAVSIPTFPALVDGPRGPREDSRVAVVRWAIASDGSVAVVTCGPTPPHRRVYLFDDHGELARSHRHEEPGCDRVELDAAGRVRLVVGGGTLYAADETGRVDLRARRERPLRPRPAYAAVYDARGIRLTEPAADPAATEADRYAAAVAPGSPSVWFGLASRLARPGPPRGVTRYDLMAPAGARPAGARFAGGAAGPGWFLFVRLRPAGRDCALRLDRWGGCTGRIDLDSRRFGPGFEPVAVDAAGRLYAVSLARGFALVRWTTEEGHT